MPITSSGATMLRHLLVISLLGVVSTGSAFAQSCSCNEGATGVTSQAALTSLLSNKMVCGNVGGEQWQEWHNGISSGAIVDFKKGPGDRTDPSAQVGTYAIGADATVSYTYGSSTYKYQVCTQSTSPGGATTTLFCGASYGGRDITNVKVGGSGLQSCAGIQ